VAEPVGGAHQSWKETAENLRHSLRRHLEELKSLPPETLVENRYKRFRNLGEYEETRRKPIPLARVASSAAPQGERGENSTGIQAAAWA